MGNDVKHTQSPTSRSDLGNGGDLRELCFVCEMSDFRKSHALVPHFPEPANWWEMGTDCGLFLDRLKHLNLHSLYLFSTKGREVLWSFRHQQNKNKEKKRKWDRNFQERKIQITILHWRPLPGARTTTPRWPWQTCRAKPSPSCTSRTQEDPFLEDPGEVPVTGSSEEVVVILLRPHARRASSRAEYPVKLSLSDSLTNPWPCPACSGQAPRLGITQSN